MALVDVAWLRERLDSVVVVDCRWSLGSPGDGRRAWEESRIPGASHLDVDADLSAAPGAGGRHPLPAPDDFAAAVGAAGVGSDSFVVAYDEAADGGAARLWWLLRHFGHGRAAVLDGGFRAWRAAGAPVESGPPEAAQRPPGAAFLPRPRADDVMDADAIAARLGDPSLALVDARAAPRYRGETEPIDPVAGHIPGAANVPFAELAPDGRYLPPDELRSRLDPGDARELVAYCGSGITAATLVLAASVAGVPARLYPGSWSEWCRRGLPAETAG